MSGERFNAKERIGMEKAFTSGVAIVAGGSGGIGSAICAALAAAGANVALTYRSRKDAADAVVGTVEAAGREALAMSVDHADPDAMKAFVDALRNVSAGSIRSSMPLGLTFR